MHLEPARPADAAAKRPDTPDAQARQVALARAGDEAAFERLVEDFTPVLMGFLIGRTSDLQDAEDIAQETWIAAHRMLPGLRRADRIGPWLMRIARRRLVDFYRERSRRPQVVWNVGPESEEGGVLPGPADRAADPDPDPARRAQGAQVRTLVIESIAWMKDRYRIILYLALFDECDAETIARRLGLRPGTVRVRLHRGLKLLRRALMRRGVDEQGAES
jgi:RNA polymerase sigma-70 factor (ECF subfamily)